MASFKFIVLTNPTEGQEDEYNSWYSDIHLGEVLDIPGFTAAQRFKVLDANDDSRWRYLAIYEIEAESAEAALEGLKARRGTPQLRMSDALDRETILAFPVEAITERMVAKS